MNLAEIEEEASKEKIDISYYVELIENTRRKYPQGKDIAIPQYMIPAIEAYCDTTKIPFFHVVEETCSVADTYSQLLVRENQR
jgi:hypothetical protein